MEQPGHKTKAVIQIIIIIIIIIIIFIMMQTVSKKEVSFILPQVFFAKNMSGVRLTGPKCCVY
jgi:preprotein translocase subunit SecG